MEKKTVLAHKTNYGMMRKSSEIKYIVIHYTANDGDKAYNNARYFQTPGLTASAHYFVDDNTIYQSVLDNYVAYSVGAKKKKKKKKKKKIKKIKKKKKKKQKNKKNKQKRINISDAENHRQRNRLD